MNPVIKRELEKIRAPLPEYDDSTTLINIPRKDSESTSAVRQFVENNCYLIELEDYILNEPPNFTLSANWNKGVVPSSKFLKVEVSRVMGKMIQVNGSGYNPLTDTDHNDTYIGLWLPASSVKVHQQL